MKNNIWKNISVFMVLGLFLQTLIPLHQAEDINRDSQIDLQDAVIIAQNLNPDENQNVEKKMADFISTVQVVAGLKTVIQPQDTDNSAWHGGDLIYVNPAIPCITKNMTVFLVYSVEKLSESIVFAPPIPPPSQSGHA